MDGYSVQEAATVLGVAEVRVWELLARGVISGTPEGDSMRVFLKAAAAPSPGPAPRDEPPRTNGNGGSHGNGGELSAFREVLTEFRNLTERYGQALLALGEARGEVAGLRSRVELLEARQDLRLPTARDDSPIAWGASAPSTPTPEPAVPASVEAVMPAPAPVRPGPRPRPRKARSKKIAMTGFADALARAQDPSVAGVGDALPSVELAVEQIAELSSEPFADVVVESIAAFDTEPIADLATEPFEDVTTEPSEDLDTEPFEDAAAAPITDLGAEPFEDVATAPIEELAAPLADVAAGAETSERSGDMAKEEASVPVRDEATELAAAEPESDGAAPTYSAAVVEPDWFADGDFAWLDAADAEARSQPEPSAVPATTEAAVAQVADADPVTAAEAELETEPTIAPEAEAEAELAAAHEDNQPEPVIVAETGAKLAPTTEDVEPETTVVAENDADVAHAPVHLEPEPDVVARADAEVAHASLELEPESVIVAEAEVVLGSEAGIESDPVTIAGAEAEVVPAPEDLEPEPGMVAEEAASADDEAYAESEIGIDATAAVEQQPVLDQAEFVEPEPSVDPESIASADTERAIASAWGAPVDPQLAGEPIFLDNEMSAEPEPDLEPELTADEEPKPADAVGSASVEADVRTSHENADPMGLVGQESASGRADPGPIALRQRDPDPAPEFRSPSGEEEMMWIGDDREAASEMKAGSRTLPVAPSRWETAATESWPAADSASKTADSTRPPLAMTEDELAQLARDEGWNDAEVAAIRAMIWRPGSPTAGLPGGEELDEAMAALDAIPVEATDDPGASREWAKSPRAEHQPPPAKDWTFELEPSLDELPPARTAPRRPLPDPSRARRRKGPAATAYRRLRRLFPS